MGIYLSVVTRELVIISGFFTQLMMMMISVFLMSSLTDTQLSFMEQEYQSLGLTIGIIVMSITGLIAVLSSAVNSGLSNTEIKQRILPNQGIWNSRINSVKIGVIAGVIVGLTIGVIMGLIIGVIVEPIAGLITGLIFVLVFGLISGLITGYKNGGITCIQHFNLRQILHRKGCIPWNYARFLDYATELRLMKKVGGGYVFYHRMLMEHFASMELKQ